MFKTVKYLSCNKFLNNHLINKTKNISSRFLSKELFYSNPHFKKTFVLSIMESVPLNVKRSQSDNLTFQSKIVSPSPIRKTSKISLNLAKELFDLPSSLEETDSTHMFGNPSSLYKSKFFSLRTETESPK